MASEFDLIARYLSDLDAGEQVVLGVGDDAALLSIRPGWQLVVSSDTALVGVHFPPDSLAEHMAWRAVAAAASDLAAMAAAPLGMTLAVTVPHMDESWFKGFSAGLADVVTALGLPLVGGDLCRGPLSIGVTVLGQVPAGGAALRGGAVSGDEVWVTGTLGDAAAGLKLWQDNGVGTGLDASDRDYLTRRFFQPTARLEYAPWIREQASSCVDISDGLLADVGHMARASGVGIEINAEALPLSDALRRWQCDQALEFALSGGDDYELVVTAPQGTAVPAEFTRVGRVVSGSGVTCLGADGGIRKKARVGYDHFA